jgi:hypothetical protein
MRISAKDIEQEIGEVEIELWEHVYRKVPATRDVVEKGHELTERWRAAETDDEAVNALAAIFDLRLKSTNGGKKAGTVIRERWKDGKLATHTIVVLLDRVRETDRPT